MVSPGPWPSPAILALLCMAAERTLADIWQDESVGTLRLH